MKSGFAGFAGAGGLLGVLLAHVAGWCDGAGGAISGARHRELMSHMRGHDNGDSD